MEKTQAEIAAERFLYNGKTIEEWVGHRVDIIETDDYRAGFKKGYNSAPQLRWKKITEDNDNELSLIMDQIEDIYVDHPLNHPKGMYAYAYYIPYRELLQLEKQD